MPKTVFILTEEVDIVGVFLSRESALNCAKANGLMNYTIEEFNLQN